MSQLTDFIHKIQLDLQGGISFAAALKIWADIKAEKPVIQGDIDALAQYITSNSAIEEGILTELIALAPEVGIPAAGVLALEAALAAIKAIVAGQAIGSDAVHQLLAGFATLNQSWATRTQQILSHLGIS